jgi:hypothetical protein
MSRSRRWGFVERKMREKEEGGLGDWYEPGAELKVPLDILSACVGCSSREETRA